MRRVLAGTLVALAVLLMLGERTPGPTREVVVAASAVEAGRMVTGDELTVEQRAVSELPQDAVTDAAQVSGSMSTVAISAGEVLTPARVLGPGTAAAGGGIVSVPLASDATGVSVGDTVDVFLPGRGSPVARAAQVVALPSAGDLTAVPEPTAVLAVPRDDAGDLVEALDADRTVGFLLLADRTPRAWQ